MRRVLSSFVLAHALVMLAVSACDSPKDGLRKCDDGLCIEVFRGIYSTEPCEGAAAQSCTYVDVFFVLSKDNTSVRDLDEADVRMSIDDHEVGVEGAASLTQQNGLLVTLLLDRSYSIEEAGATEQVRAAAKGFLAALPDEAVVAVAGFASETQVPVPLASGGEQVGALGYFALDATGRAALDATLEGGYAPYQAPESQAFTKLYDAVANLAELRPKDGDHAAMQAVAIALSDDADTASSAYRSAGEAITHVGEVAPDLKLYAVGLGDAIDEHALEQLSEGRSYLAADASALQTAFSAVANDLGAIYRYRILVAEAGYDARAEIGVTYGGHRLETSFDLASIGGGGGGGVSDAGGSDPATSSDPPTIPTSPTCELPCTTSDECSAGEACLATTVGTVCMPAMCDTCFAVELTCNYLRDTCAFSTCT